MHWQHVLQLLVFRVKEGSAKDILRRYRLLQLTSSVEMRKRRYDELKQLVQRNQDSLYELIFSGKLSEDDLRILIWVGGNSASCQREENRHWHAFINRVRARKCELPQEIQDHLDWYEAVHGW